MRHVSTAGVIGLVVVFLAVIAYLVAPGIVNAMLVAASPSGYDELGHPTAVGTPQTAGHSGGQHGVGHRLVGPSVWG